MNYDMPWNPMRVEQQIGRVDRLGQRYPVVRIVNFGPREYGYLAPGMSRELRVTTAASYYEAHADSVELWSPGAPVFPDPRKVLGGAESGSASVASQTVASYSAPDRRGAGAGETNLFGADWKD